MHHTKGQVVVPVLFVSVLHTSGQPTSLLLCAEMCVHDLDVHDLDVRHVGDCKGESWNFQTGCTCFHSSATSGCASISAGQFSVLHCPLQN